MKNKILPDNLQPEADTTSIPIEWEGIQNNPDKHIEQGFTGYPHAPLSEEIIDPQEKKKNTSPDTDEENANG